MAKLHSAFHPVNSLSLFAPIEGISGVLMSKRYGHFFHFLKFLMYSKHFKLLNLHSR